MISHIVRKRDKTACTLATGHLNVKPQILKNASQVRFTASVETTHPHRGLLSLTEVGQEASEDSLEAVLVLPLTDKARQLPLEHVPLLLRLGTDHLGDAVI